MLHLHADGMPYAILRTAKLKSMGEIAGSLSHTYRTRETPNADPSRASLNEHHGGSDPATVRAAIRARIPEKHRKDAVLCVEYFVGASPEFFDSGGDADAYFAGAVKWLQERHGAENLVAWSIHRDETSPHLVGYVVPLDSAGKLNAKQFLGGKAKLSAMQTDFAARVGAAVGLERGIEGSKATHTSIRQYYQALNRPDFKHGRLSAETLQPKVLEKRLLTKTVESPEQVAERLTRAVQAYYGPAITAGSTAALEKRRAVEMAKTAKAKDQALREARAQLEAERARLADLRALFLDGLTPEQQQALAAQAANQRRENWIAAEAKRRAEALAELARKAAGAALVFARRGVRAIEEAAGRWRSVDWGKVEQETVREAVAEHGRSMSETVGALLDHSPGHAGTSREQAAEILAEVARREASQPQRHRQRAEPTRDYGPAPR